jgi:hypothetical protein
LIEHFGQGLLQSRDKEMSLEIDCMRQKLTELTHLSRIHRAMKGSPRVPGTEGGLIEPHGDCDVTFMGELKEFGKAFFKRTAHTFWIPNEMPDSKGSEIFAGVP